MDALTLPLVSNPAATLPGAAENSLLDLNAGEEGTDFASLLAAGLASQQAMPQAAPGMAPVDEVAVAPEREREPLTAAAEPGLMPLAGQAVPLVAAGPAIRPGDASVQTDTPAHGGSSGATATSPRELPLSAANGTGSSVTPNASLAAKAVKVDDADHASDPVDAAQASLSSEVGRFPAGGDATSASIAAATATIAAKPAGSGTLAGIQSDGTLPDARTGAEATSPAHTGATNSTTHAPFQLEGAGQRPTGTPTAVLDVPAPVRSAQFPAALSQQVVWMLDKDAQVAELHLNPPDLGPVEVRLTLNGEDASAQFVSPHAEVRSAIEASLVRLREAMAEAGIQLGEASVSADSFRGEQSSSDTASARARAGYDEGIASTEQRTTTPPGLLRRNGLVDVFA